MSAVPEHDVVPFEKPAVPTGRPAVPLGKPAAPITATSPPPRRVRPRASDADRQATVHLLQDALARGQLTFEEAGDRMTAAWASRYVADLAPLTADLPPVPEPAAAPGWTAVAQLALAQLRASIATAFDGGPRSARTRLALAATLLGLLMLVVLVGATAHALIDGPGFGGPGFGGPGGWHGPHPRFGGA